MESAAQRYEGFFPKPAPELNSHKGSAQLAPIAIGVACPGGWANPTALGNGHSGVPPPLHAAAQPTAEPALLPSTANSCGSGQGLTEVREGARLQGIRSLRARLHFQPASCLFSRLNHEGRFCGQLSQLRWAVGERKECLHVMEQHPHDLSQVTNLPPRP